MSIVVVTGASGFVGSHVVPELIDGGHQVIALVRSEAAGRKILGRLPADARARVELRSGDVTDPVIARAGPGRRRRGRPPRGAPAGLERRPGPRAGEPRGDPQRDRGRPGGRASGGSSTMGALGVADEPHLHYASSKARAEALVRASSARLDDPQAVAPVGRAATASSTSWPASSGCRPASCRSRATARPASSPSPSSDARRGDPPVGRAAVHDRADVRARRSALLDLSRDHPGGASAGWARRRLIVPDARLPLISLVARTAEAVHLPFPVATRPAAPAQDRQHRSPRRLPGGLRVRPTGDGRQPGLPGPIGGRAGTAGVSAPAAPVRPTSRLVRAASAAGWLLAAVALASGRPGSSAG